MAGGIPFGGSVWEGGGPNRFASSGQVSDEPLTWTAHNASTVGAASAELVAAAAGTGRLVVISVPNTATGGIHINFGAAATTSKYPIQPGSTIAIPTEQQITAIRAGAVDVTAYVLTGVVA